MKWNRKFNYPRSSRSVINGSRHYSINQQQLPSVTAILSRTKPEEDKAALAAWKLRMGEKESERIKNEASANGTKMHNILESYLRGRENLELLEFEEENNLAQKMADLIIAEGINGKLDEIHGVECTSFIIQAPRGFAGTADLSSNI